jgi:nucleoside permease NupC
MTEFAGYFFIPFAYMMGVTEYQDALRIGQLIAFKILSNDFVAFAKLGVGMGTGVKILEAFLYYLLPHTIFTVFYNTFYYFLHYIL